jgi:pentatricopeptide repeat protein
MCGYGLRPDLVIWNSVVSGFALAGDNQMTAELVRGMQEDGFQMDVITRTSLISGSMLNLSTTGCALCSRA